MGIKMKDVKLRWQDAFKERKFVVSFFVSLIMFAGLMLFLSDFQSNIELREGVVFKDPLFGDTAPAAVDLLLFIAIYSVHLIAVIAAFTRPEKAVQIALGYFFVFFFRIFALYLLPLNPPEGTIPLYDPILIWFGKGEIITKDLFYSGHTATTFMVFLVTTNKKIRCFIGISLLIIVYGVLIQKLHYSIDVYKAFFVAYTAYRVSTIIVNKLNFKFCNRKLEEN